MTFADSAALEAETSRLDQAEPAGSRPRLPCGYHLGSIRPSVPAPLPTTGRRFGLCDPLSMGNCVKRAIPLSYGPTDIMREKRPASPGVW